MQKVQALMSRTPEASILTGHAALRHMVDRALEESVRFPSGCPRRLADAIHYGLLGPGKRLRPRLVLMAADACGGNFHDALPAACAVEMVHAYSLIHDDLPAMDDDDLRRGRPTCHKVYGEALAILAGDALLARALEILATDVLPPSKAARCVAALARAAGPTQLVGGQADDLLGGTQRPSPADLEDIHRRKTGALFRVALRLGGWIADASAEQLDMLDTYGTKVGLAFQITDDLLDSVDSSAPDSAAGRAGNGPKPAGFPLMTGAEASRRRARELVQQACRALEAMGPRGTPFIALAREIAERRR